MEVEDHHPALLFISVVVVVSESIGEKNEKRKKTAIVTISVSIIILIISLIITRIIEQHYSVTYIIGTSKIIMVTVCSVGLLIYFLIIGLYERFHKKTINDNDKKA